MKRSVAALLAAVFLLPAFAGAAFHFPKDRDAYFIEDNLAYRRFLELRRDGAYLQINQDRTSCREVDEGTWEQAANGMVRLHSVHHALRFRALLAGPLTVVLDSQAKLDAMPSLAAAVRRFLASRGYMVFTPHTVDECNLSLAVVAIDPGAETYRRDELTALLQQLDDATATERTGVYILAPSKRPDMPALLILQDAVFQASEVARVCRDYRVKPGKVPPFYFAQVDAPTFVRNVGTWTAFHFLGGTE